MAKNNNRRNFGKGERNLPKLNLLEVQIESWDQFVAEGIPQELQEISPIDDFTGKNWQIILSDPILGKPKLPPRQTQQKGLTYSSPLKISAASFSRLELTILSNFSAAAS